MREEEKRSEEEQDEGGEEGCQERAFSEFVGGGGGGGVLTLRICNLGFILKILLKKSHRQYNCNVTLFAPSSKYVQM